MRVGGVSSAVRYIIMQSYVVALCCYTVVMATSVCFARVGASRGEIYIPFGALFGSKRQTVLVTHIERSSVPVKSVIDVD